MILASVHVMNRTSEWQRHQWITVLLTPGDNFHVGAQDRRQPIAENIENLTLTDRYGCFGRYCVGL